METKKKGVHKIGRFKTITCSFLLKICPKLTTFSITELEIPYYLCQKKERLKSLIISENQLFFENLSLSFLKKHFFLSDLVKILKLRKKNYITLIHVSIKIADKLNMVTMQCRSMQRGILRSGNLEICIIEQMIMDWYHSSFKFLDKNFPIPPYS